MAKRFTDSDKWKKPWFRKLKPGMKVFWQYILDNCDHAGIWEVDFELASDFVGEKLNEKTITEAFRKQVFPFHGGRRWFILDFIEFQYGELRENSNTHKSVITILKRNRLWDVYLARDQAEKDIAATLHEPLANPSRRVQDKDKDQDKDTDKGEEGLGEGAPEEADAAFVRRVVGYLNEKARKSFRPSTEATAAAIRARRAEGYTFEDFRIVIDKKCADWLTDPRMEKYLAPDTLFRPGHFEKYRNQHNAGADHGQIGSGWGRGKPSRSEQLDRDASEFLGELRGSPAGNPEANHPDAPVRGTSEARG